MVGSSLASEFVLQTGTGGGGGAALLFPLVFLAVIVIAIAGMWKTFTKAGQPGWAAIIPIYNLYILLKIAGRPVWWLIVILFIPLVNILLMILVGIDVAKAFGKGTGFGIGLAILGFIFFPILGFGDAQYHGAPN